MFPHRGCLILLCAVDAIGFFWLSTITDGLEGWIFLGISIMCFLLIIPIPRKES